MICRLRETGKTYKEIEELLGVSPTVIRNSLRYTNKPETRGPKRKTTENEDRRIVRYSKQRPSASSNEILKELNIPVSAVTVRRRLRENDLYGRSPRKVPLLTKKHVDARLKFARTHVEWPAKKWRNILWSDESKIVLFGGTGSRQYVRRPPNTEYHPNYTIKTVKHGGISIMIWACMSYAGVGPIFLINGIMDQHVYCNILETVMLPYAEDEMPLKWIFQQDNDPKHTSKVAKAWFAAKKIEVMAWPAQSPDLNPIENLWADIKKKVSEFKPSSRQQLWEVVRTEWEKIPEERCQNLVDSMPRRCLAVIKNNGYTTKY